MSVAAVEMASARGRTRRVLDSLANVSSVAWMPGEEMDYRQWLIVGRRLGALGRCSQWWLGDWIRFGNVRFGERYARAARITGYDVHTLVNMVYVASRFEISRRRDDLSWSHHEALASLDHGEQELWFERAVAQRLSVADLRGELRSVRRADARRTVTVASSEQPVVTCPECGCTFVLAGAARNR
jgi:hypothetical protein